MRDQMRDKDDLDLLLDSALSTYADSGTDAGLEHRVLAALSAARDSDGRKITAAKPRRRWLPWAIAIPVTACIILLWVLASTRVVHAPTQPQQASEAQPAPFVPPAAGRAERPPKSTQRTHHAVPIGRHPAQLSATEPLPKLDVFPTPQPLTEQEQAFLFYAQQAPTAQLKALSDAQARDEDPFPVATVHIPAFEPPMQGTN